MRARDVSAHTQAIGCVHARNVSCALVISGCPQAISFVYARDHFHAPKRSLVWTNIPGAQCRTLSFACVHSKDLLCADWRTCGHMRDVFCRHLRSVERKQDTSMCTICFLRDHKKCVVCVYGTSLGTQANHMCTRGIWCVEPRDVLCAHKKSRV